VPIGAVVDVWVDPVLMVACSSVDGRVRTWPIDADELIRLADLGCPLKHDRQRRDYSAADGDPGGAGR
jgi:hypothetical protein